jgi:hypothetical protein
MANHCIDVTCAKCGRTWCVRCFDLDRAKPSKKLSNEAKEEIRDGRAIMASGAECSCGGKEVVHA